jgi:hypothetical protein
MKKNVRKFRAKKYKRFTSGLLFAIISIIALILCLFEISDHAGSLFDIILPFGIAIISMLMGFISMFHENEASKDSSV